jgi:DNA-binding SARP family transcriptional activator
VRVCLLGPDLLAVDGRTVHAGGLGQRSLLVRLALANGHLVTVDRLVEDLWGDAATSSIVGTLHGYVSRLRALLGDPSRLRRTGPGYLLELDTDEVDAREFEALLADGRRSLHEDPAHAAEQLGRALDLWRGPALADVAATDWGAAAAARLESLRLGATEARFDALLESGQHDVAAAELQHAVVEHPVHERFVAQLMVALYRCGRQHDALAAYQRARHRLVDELGLDPSPELTRHEAAVLAHEPWLDAPGSALGSAAPAVTAPAGTAPAGTAPAGTAPPAAPRGGGTVFGPGPLPAALERVGQRAFVGRAAELATVEQALARVRAGGRELVLLEGEAGAGKTRLAARVASAAHAAGAAVLYGRATSDSIIPYEPFVEALRAMLHGLADHERHVLLANRPGLRQIVPFLGDAPASEPSPVDDALTDRYVLFETVAELTATASTAWPVVLVIDDAHWCDPLSARLLGHLLRHERPSRLLVLATVRTVPRHPNADLDTLVNDADRDGVLTRVRVGGLHDDDVAELLRVTQGDDAAAARVASVVAATHGNAFFVSEIAEHPGDGSLPANVRDAIGVRLARLSDDAGRVIRTAAVAGAVTPIDVLQAATGLDEAALLDAVDETIAAGLLVEEGGRPALGFRHAIVQQVVVDSVAQLRRRVLHRDLAAAYRSLPGEALRHAHHLLEAGELAGGQLADAAIAAGRQALAVFAYEDAVTWGERALDAGASAAQRCQALLLVSDARRALGDRMAARAAAGGAAELAREVGDATLLAAAAEAVALARAGVGFDFGVDDEGLDELLREALGRLPAAEVEQRSRLLEASLSSAAASGDLYALRGLSAEAVELAERHGHQALVATAHLAARMSVWRVDLLEQRLQSDVAARAAADQSGRVHLQLNSLLYLVSDLAEAGRQAESDAWFQVLRDLATRVRQPVYDAFVDFFDARTALLQGRYDEAAKLADHGLRVGHHSHGVNAEQAWAGVMFVSAWDHGRLHTLADVVEAAAAAAPRFPIWRVAGGACALAGGDRERAATVLEQLVHDGEVDHPLDSLWYASLGLLAEIARTLGDEARARALFEALRPYSGRLTITGLGRVSLGPLDRFVGVAAAAAGDLDVAIEHFARAEDQARRLGAVPHVARAMWERGTALARRGDAAPAEQLLADAASLAGEVGMVLGAL